MLKEEDKTLGGTHITTIISPLEKVKGGLYIGGLESFTNVNILRKFRIRAVLSVMDSDINAPQELGITHMQIRVRDTPDENIFDHFRPAFEFISTKRKQCNVLVHCMAGVSRSSAFVIGYLIVSRQISLEKAYDTVREQRPSVKPNDGFVKQLRTLETLTKKYVQTRQNIKNQMKGLFD